MQIIDVMLADDTLGDEDISRVFTEKCQALFNSACYDKDDLAKLVLELNNLTVNEPDDTVQHYVS